MEITSRILKSEKIDWQKAKWLQNSNLKDLSEEANEKLKTSLRNNFFVMPFVVWQENEDNLWILDGHHRQKILLELQAEGVEIEKMLDATFISCANKKEAAQLVLIYTSQYAKITQSGLDDFLKIFEINIEDISYELDIPNINFEPENHNENIAEIEAVPVSLAERFIIPPFSIFDTKQKYWIDRERAWKSQGLVSEKGREEGLAYSKSSQAPAYYNFKNNLTKQLGRETTHEEALEGYEKAGYKMLAGTSIFSPTLCEILYKWFCPENGAILDPFAGGSVRGVVASMLGYNYTGIDLRTEQIEENQKQAHEIIQDSNCALPVWHAGNSLELDKICPSISSDFVFSCPPYYDLEVYSDGEGDLSNLGSYEEFLTLYKEIIHKAVKTLKNDRFACFVVTNIRDKKGFYRNFVNDTISCFESAGAMFYNDIILVNQIASAAIRAKRSFEAGRKVAKVHQNVLVFYKGDTKNIRENFPAISISTAEILEMANLEE